MPEDKTKKYLKPEFPGNSNTSKDAEPAPDKEEKVVEGNVIQRKKSFSKRFAEMFTDGDAHNVGEYIIWDIAIPALKNMISDMVSNGAERMLFGEGGGRSRSRSNDRYRSNYTSYDRMYSSSNRRDDRDNRREMSRSGRSRHNFKEIVLESRGEADDVLYRLMSRIDRYGQCAVSDLYDLVGISSNYMDDKWGWTDLRDSHVQRARGGFLLDLPAHGAPDHFFSPTKGAHNYVRRVMGGRGSR